jgi:axial budding pattern protein 2
MFFVLPFSLLAHIVVPVLATSISVPIPLNDQLPPVARINCSYSWAFAEDTFLSAAGDAPLVYSVSPLPAWLSFDPVTRTFNGVPAPDDEGTLPIKVVVTDPKTSDSAFSSVTLCVTPDPAPVLTTPVASQFKPDNPSLSSVFVLSGDNSALQMTKNPTLRIPPSWSFSIGFDGYTFTSLDDGMRYDVLLADGSPLPSWMNFDPDEITLNGVTPPPHELRTPHLTLALHVSDRFGFSAASQRFDLAIAAHEVHTSLGGLLPINITSSTTVNVSLDKQNFFAGVFVDGSPLDPQDVVSVGIDVSPYSWLHYDADSSRLTGQPPGDLSTLNATVLSVVLATTYNQTLHTQVKLASVPPFLSCDTLPQISAARGRDVHFDLTPLLNATREDVDLMASYEPADASSYLHFDTASATLSGHIPSSGKTDYNLVMVSFAAYSHLTHSTSNCSLPITLKPPDSEPTQPTTGSSFHVSRKKLALGLGIAFGLLGGLLVLGILLAALRLLARPPDSALTGTAAAQAMTEGDRQWYGIGDDAAQTEERSDSAEKGYGARTNGHWGELGTGLARSQSFTSSNDERTLASPGQLSKAEFLGRLRATVRKVSNRYRGARKSAIGRPVLVLEAGDPRVLGTPVTPAIPALARYEAMAYSASTSSLRGSPSSSSGERSIPQRRPDFAPPRVPAPLPSHSPDSDMSLASDSSARSHAAEAVVQRAARARSIRSVGGQSRAENDAARARVVPFAASRTPAPRDGPAGEEAGVSLHARASSLSASVVRVIVAPPNPEGCGTAEADELHVGLHYVRALGEDTREASGSFSSLESSHPARSSLGSGGAGGHGREVLRVLVRVGERFRFRLPVRTGARAGGLTARRVSGELLPAFLYADLDNAREDRHRDTVKFWGVPRADDVGDVHVGVYAANGECVAEAVIEVLIRSG